MKINLFKKIRKCGLSVFASIGGGIIIFLMLAVFNDNIEKTVEQFIHSSMDEMNQTAVIALNNGIDNSANLLEKQAELIGMMDALTDDEILKILKDFAQEKGYKNASIITFDGKIYSSFRGLTELKKDDMVPNLQKEGTIVSQPRTFADGTLVIDISTNVELKGRSAGKLVVCLSSEYIESMFFDNILQGDAALNLVTREGMIIARISSKESVLESKLNVVNFYDKESVDFIVGSTQEMSKKLKAGKPLTLKYKYLDGTICASYIPFGMNNWSMGIEATDNTLKVQSGIIDKNVFQLTIGVMIIVFAATVIVIIQRINERKKIDILKNTYNIAIRKTNDLFYEADIDNRDFVNHTEQKDKEIWKAPPKNYSDALRQVADICAPECRQQFLDMFLPQNIRIKMKEGISSINFEYKITPDENDVRWLSATFVPIDDGMGSTKLICMENDITEQRSKQEILENSATLDVFTGLYNKATTEKYIEWFLHNEGRDGRHALILMDIDNFKSINDTLGHAMGDEILKTFARLLNKISRKSDIKGRVGGDEFMILLKDYCVEELIVSKVNEILSKFNKKYVAEDCKEKIAYTSTSIGIAVYDRDGKNFSELYKAADIALYESKENGRNRFTFSAGSTSEN